ncbi:DUF421 domain-containing protein [Chengkuizengella sp. 2205SS18-9]|uniref:DUF421 domain-containing protein n=1 Tax=Chengkuizengella axinellae TaxID=3064388 RepID=A0ABT9IW50_9BACL|nr:DUF421 domain-containing protein [Chengkuizengella sp. 2205SS18-9]MDP5273015.1 DUF421 domain-containing protein [Chengkuizengella sp. 2205SS18-9]
MPDWIHIVWKSLTAIILMFLLTRFLLGNRQISELNYFQYIVGITIGSLAGFSSINIMNWSSGLIALIVWAFVAYLIEMLLLKSKKIRDVMEGKGTILIKEGKILEDNMKSVKYNTDDLLSQLRKKNAFKVADVEFAVLETSGDLSVLLKRENLPITAQHLGMKLPNEQEPQTVIMDGNVINEPLATIGLNREWLHTELEKIGVTIENVFLAQVDNYGELYVDLYDDQLKIPEPQQRAILLSTLKKCAADLELFCLSTENEAAKQMYEQSLMKMNKMISRLKPLLQ